jgi:hypothetical protein
VAAAEDRRTVASLVAEYLDDGLSRREDGKP